MTRKIYYTYNASAVPADPTDLSDEYTEPFAYADGYYKARAYNNNDISAVTSKSFGMIPDDYIHYYPLIADFNDAKGSNDLTNVNCTVDSNGCLIDSNSDLMNFTSALNQSEISMFLQYKPSGTNTWRNLFGNNGSQCALFCSGNTLGYYNSGFVTSSITLTSGTNYKIICTKTGGTQKIYVDGNEVLSRTDSFANNSYPIVNLGGNSYGQSALGIIKDVMIFDRILTPTEIAQLSA